MFFLHCSRDEHPAGVCFPEPSSLFCLRTDVWVEGGRRPLGELNVIISISGGDVQKGHESYLSHDALPEKGAPVFMRQGFRWKKARYRGGKKGKKCMQFNSYWVELGERGDAMMRCPSNSKVGKRPRPPTSTLKLPFKSSFPLQWFEELASFQRLVGKKIPSGTKLWESKLEGSFSLCEKSQFFCAEWLVGWSTRRRHRRGLSKKAKERMKERKRKSYFRFFHSLWRQQLRRWRHAETLPIAHVGRSRHSKRKIRCLAKKWQFSSFRVQYVQQSRNIYGLYCSL